jgi:hypothetical protein
MGRIYGVANRARMRNGRTISLLISPREIDALKTLYQEGRKILDAESAEKAIYGFFSERSHLLMVGGKFDEYVDQGHVRDKPGRPVTPTLIGSYSMTFRNPSGGWLQLDTIEFRQDGGRVHYDTQQIDRSDLDDEIEGPDDDDRFSLMTLQEEREFEEEYGVDPSEPEPKEVVWSPEPTGMLFIRCSSMRCNHPFKKSISRDCWPILRSNSAMRPSAQRCFLLPGNALPGPVRNSRRQRCSPLGFTSNARAASPIKTPCSSRRTTASLNSLVNNLRDNSMTQFSFKWILSLNCLCQNWGQVHTPSKGLRVCTSKIFLLLLAQFQRFFTHTHLADYLPRRWRNSHTILWIIPGYRAALLIVRPRLSESMHSLLPP